MTDTQTCKSCGQTKPLIAYERLHTGGYRGTCLDCRRAMKGAAKRARREAYEASPEYQALCAAKEAERQEAALQSMQAKLERETAKAKQAEDAALAVIHAKLEREAALRDDIWSAMWTGRSRRALSAVRPHRPNTGGLKLKDGSGYISVAEFACRVAERNAVHRATKACRTHEEALAAVRVLERDTQGPERSREMIALARAATGHWIGPALPEEAAAVAEEDPFVDAFGDWAPAWMLAEGP